MCQVSSVTLRGPQKHCKQTNKQNFLLFAMMGITGAFSSLGINEEVSPLKSPKKHSTLSLPNLVTTDRGPPISVKPFRTPYCDDEIESSEQPIDFSKKYCETKQPSTFNKVVKSYHNSFTIYAETDLDQPTDYSLRYAEDDSDTDQQKVKNENAEFVQDTIKTYCTEDTPYETPFNFSTATSMSDLRIDDKGKPKEVQNLKIKSEFSSGLMSPEKPVNYCEEGTPGYFSRVPSCGSLNSIPKQEPKEEKKEKKFGGEPKAVKFEEVVNYAEETPLMFSRSSSLASLDSIEQHSIHDDRSSVVSDFSRLTSGLISPSELPDSPSQTVPPSPKPRKTPLMFPSIPKKINDLTKGDEIEVKTSVFEDVVKKFKMESTPLHFSAATSLSSLIDDEVDSKEVKEEPNLDLNNDLSESSEDENILEACINIGMQNNRYSQPTRPDTKKSPQQLPILVSESDDLLRVDSVKTYCTEGTPAVLSHARSNSDLSNLSDKKNFTDELANEEKLKAEVSLVVEDDRDVAGEKQIDATAAPRSRSSFSSLSDDSDGCEEALLQECILAGMPTKTTVIPQTPNILEKTEENLNENELSDDEDDNILTDCINIGIANNRYTKVNNEIVNDTIKSYCTEDTPAVLSHTGSCSDLSVLSSQNGVFSDLNSNVSEEDDERLLDECVKIGMAKIAESKFKNGATEGASSSHEKETGKTTLIWNTENPRSSDSDDLSSLSDNESEQALLQQCIQAGMPKRDEPFKEDTNDLTPAEKALLRQCILDGMKKFQIVPKKLEVEESGELTEAEQTLLRQCILSGMPKNKNLVKQGGPSRESAELSEAERALLQQCILAGMPKSRKRKEEEKEHTCCVHCPRNQSKGPRQGRRRKLRETRDVNIVYVTSQVVTLKKEMVKHEEWI